MPSLTRAGVKLHYEEAGSGRPPLLLVHGWTCDHTYFSPQADYFQKSHRVISVDLRGHGQSDKPEQAYSMGAFADDLAWLCGELKVEKPVVIGHSMGGVIALEMAAAFPDLPAAIVIVDSPIVSPAPLLEMLEPVRAGLKSPHYREVAAGFVADALFLPTDDPERKAKIVAGMTAAPQHVMASAFDNIFTWDGAKAAAGCKVPVLDIAAANPLADLERFRSLCPQLIHGQTVGAGHFNQLEVPDQVNAMIERFLAIAVK